MHICFVVIFIGQSEWAIVGTEYWV